MSSINATAVQATGSIWVRRLWNRHDFLTHIAAMFGAFWLIPHRGHSSYLSVLACALLLGALLPQREILYRISPLEIDRTVRLLQGILIASGIAIFHILLLPTQSAVTLELLCAFLALLVVGRILLRQPASSAGTYQWNSSSWEAGSGSRRLKQCFDRVLAFTALTILAPAFVLAAFAIKLDSPGPVFFSQLRIGHRGKKFSILKFRSMHAGTPAYHRSPVDVLDPRITRAGRILRRFSLDEIPQLINVLRGEMSLVGPRPEMPFIADTYTAIERQRLAVIPGITGLWRISPARALPIHQDLQYDFYYIGHQSMLLDVAILLRTAASVVRGIGAA